MKIQKQNVQILTQINRVSSRHRGSEQSVFVESKITFIILCSTVFANRVLSAGSRLQFVCLKDYNSSKSNRHLEHLPYSDNKHMPNGLRACAGHSCIHEGG